MYLVLLGPVVESALSKVYMKIILKIILKKILIEKGLSLVEIIVTIGLIAIVSLGGIKLAQKSQSGASIGQQNIAIDSYMRLLKQKLRVKASCDLMVGNDPRTIDLSSVSANLENKKIKVKNIRTIMPPRSNRIQVLPVSIYVTFDRNLPDMAQTPVRKVFAHAQFSAAGDFSGCVDFENESIKTSNKIACESLGGSFVDGIQDTFSCDFKAMTGNEVFIQNIIKDICKDVFKGSFGGGKCNSISVTGNVEMQNINSSGITLQGNKRNNFDQACRGSNTFIRGINNAGNVSCIEVGFCTKGVDC